MINNIKFSNETFGALNQRTKRSNFFTLDKSLIELDDLNLEKEDIIDLKENLRQTNIIDICQELTRIIGIKSAKEKPTSCQAKPLYSILASSESEDSIIVPVDCPKFDEIKDSPLYNQVLKDRSIFKTFRKENERVIYLFSSSDIRVETSYETIFDIKIDRYIIVAHQKWCIAKHPSMKLIALF